MEKFSCTHFEEMGTEVKFFQSVDDRAELSMENNFSYSRKSSL